MKGNSDINISLKSSKLVFKVIGNIIKGELCMLKLATRASIYIQ